MLQNAVTWAKALSIRLDKEQEMGNIVNLEIAEKALAISVHRNGGHSSMSTKDILDEAKQFYDFLSGSSYHFMQVEKSETNNRENGE